ncbi:hypothetical protein ACFVWR_19010 [Leifsonia sp. NPDC058292]|uniref:hypothetical protein n=1 Tax=Leifsonia sp. NPDC058292 TaxID=3346428 RepID=UPI0036D81656
MSATAKLRVPCPVCEHKVTIDVTILRTDVSAHAEEHDWQIDSTPLREHIETRHTRAEWAAADQSWNEPSRRR